MRPSSGATHTPAGMQTDRTSRPASQRGSACGDMVVVASRSPAPGVVLLLATALLLASTATGVAAAATGSDSGTICDTAKCAKGTCSEVPGLVPLTAGYKCTCDPGWSQPKLLNLLPAPEWAPCMVPDCTFDSSCYNFSFLWTLPKGIPILDPCVAVNCGGGECKLATTGWWNYTCECHEGYSNFLGLAKLPCMKNCSFGEDCSKVLGPPTPPPAPSTTAPPPGSATSWRLLQQLLSPAILLLLQIV